MPQLLSFNKHLRDTLLLSLPIIATQIGQIVTGMVDNMFLGHIGKTEQGAGILANNMFYLLLVFSIGMTYATTPLTSTAHMNDNDEEKVHLFKNSLALNLGISLLVFIVLFLCSPLMHYMGQEEDVIRLAVPFFNVLIFSIIPISVFFVCKQYCEGLSNTRAAMYISVIGNLVNILLNYLLIYGKWGLPEMGYMGSCWATFIARTGMAIGFLIYIFYHKSTLHVAEWFRKVGIQKVYLMQLFKLGIGSALQYTFEVAAFALSGFMAGALGKERLDAHGIALSIAAFTYMFGSGIGGAVTIRVGNFKAMNDYANVRRAGNTAFALTLMIMGATAIIFFLFHALLPVAFSKEPDVLLLASQLLIIAGFFQLFDGAQVTALGILRGLEDVKFPTIVTLIGYWVIALPLAWLLTFRLHMDVEGIWYALSISLMFVALCLYLRIRVLIKRKVNQF